MRAGHGGLGRDAAHISDAWRFSSWKRMKARTQWT
jgi:hypothetical protein